MLDAYGRNNPDGYNEVIVSSAYWMSHLPNIIEAFISGHGANNIASGAHQQFLAKYGLTDEQVPLLGWL